MDSAAPTERFTDRVAAYVQSRPSYPAALLEELARHAGLTADATVADVGSGTGIFARLLLQRGARVFAIEPNAAMRAAAEAALAGEARFTSIAATAESTGLPDASVDLVTAAQAFHWFRVEETRREFRRILKPGGHVALIWNERQVDTTPFLRGYEALLHGYGTDYVAVSHRHVDPQRLDAFFGQGRFVCCRFPSAQHLDYPGLEARLLSSSYAPNAGHPQHEPMLSALRTLFDRTQVEGRVSIEYETRLYYGAPAAET